MVPEPPHVISTSTQAWKLIEKDYTLRLSLVAHKWAEEHETAKKMLFAEARRRGNSAYLGPAWVDMEIADTNKRAEWAYRACCEVWEIQGRPKCRAFFRGVFDWCLQPIFAVRKGCFKSQLDLHQTRTRRTIPQSTAIYGHMTRQMGRLISEWNTRLEIETRDGDYQAEHTKAREEETHPIVGQLPDSIARAWYGPGHSAQVPQPSGELTPSIARAWLGPGKTAQLPTAQPLQIPNIPTMKRASKQLSQAEKRRRQVIFGAIQAHLKGHKYCSELDLRRLPLPLAWKDQGCPDTYVQAYKDPIWRKRIQDEKCTLRERFDQTPPREREAIIEGATGTRRTRH